MRDEQPRDQRQLRVHPRLLQVDGEIRQHPDARDQRQHRRRVRDAAQQPAFHHLQPLAHDLFRIPRSVLTICLGKSTYARCGIIVNVTP